MKTNAVICIDSTPQLEQFCASVRRSEWLALDTEFLREKTYFPKFCLLQIASDSNQIACIDPIALPSLEPLRELLFDPAILKVFHAGRQDLEIFFHLWGELPGPVFDTQIAAPLVGMPEQISYAGLVSELLGVNLSKSHTRTDWSIRPLSDSQIRYAADDVIYLAAAFQKLRDKLQGLGRYHWPTADFNLMLQPALYENAPDLAWQRISGTHQLRDRSLVVLQTLAGWRETIAREENVPRSWIIKDEMLINLAKLMPKSLEDFRLIRGLDERIVKRHGELLIHLIGQLPAKSQSIELKSKPPRKSPEQEALLDALSAVVRLNAENHSLNPVMLASRKDLEQFLDKPDESKLLEGWRKSMIGEDLLAILHGEMNLRVEAGRLLKVSRCG